MLPLLGYMALVFALSHSSRPPLPRELLQLGDKLLHALEYVPMGLLCARLFPGSFGRRVLLGWLAAAAFGLTDEIHQAFVPGRQPSLLDWVADATGAAVGALAVALAGSLPRKKLSQIKKISH